VRDGMHPNSTGCRAAAEIMAEILEKNGYLRD
jgi:lysophospholipase L1-like esterase